MNCRADAIPESFTADLSGLDIGDAVRISNIFLPEGVEPVINYRDFTIATITASSAAIEEAAEEAAAAEAIMGGLEDEDGQTPERADSEAAGAPAGEGLAEGSEDG